LELETKENKQFMTCNNEGKVLAKKKDTRTCLQLKCLGYLGWELGQLIEAWVVGPHLDMPNIEAEPHLCNRPVVWSLLKSSTSTSF
jgi:hypothetical protein